MAGTSLLALLDDIATVLDDIAVMTKVAAKKTAGVLGDDLALNAEQVSGVSADRELPVVWAVAKGSFKNKLILVPAALVTSAVAPGLITPLLMLGGLYLCFEGFEKVAHRFIGNKEDEASAHAVKLRALQDATVDLVAFERAKVKGAIRTDFILSAEIIVIALGTVQDKPVFVQTTVVAGIALLMTVGVYALVAGIVKLDDAGLHLLKSAGSNFVGSLRRVVGRSVLRLAPYLMKTLSIVGTAAMFLVGGGILMHGLPGADAVVAAVSAAMPPVVAGRTLLAALVPAGLNALAGVVAGCLALMTVSSVKMVFSRIKG